MNNLGDVKVAVVDDHPILREAISTLLLRHGCLIVGEASSVEEGIDLLGRIEADVAIVDLNLHQSNGLNLVERLSELHPKIKVVVYTNREAIYAIASAYKLGAAACVTKSSSSSVLIDAIQCVMTGDIYFMSGIPERLAHLNYSAQEKDPRDVLTEKELETFLRVAKGYTQEEMVDQLNVGENAISMRMADIRKKLNCITSDFHRIATRYHLITLDE